MKGLIAIGALALVVGLVRFVLKGMSRMYEDDRIWAEVLAERDARYERWRQ